MVGIQIGKEQEERKREEEGLNFETTPWWNFRNHHGLCGRRAAEREFVKFVKLRAQPTAKAKAMHHMEGGLCMVAHYARRGEENLSWKRIVREVEDGKSK